MNRTLISNEPRQPVPLHRHRSVRCYGLRKRALMSISAIIIGSVGSHAMAASKTSTKLVRCGTTSCLQVSGHRDNQASTVTINGREMPVEGKHAWRARMAVETVREFSNPYARTIEVSLRDPQTQLETIISVELPIGLLGNLTDFASLEVRAR